MTRRKSRVEIIKRLTVGSLIAALMAQMIGTPIAYGMESAPGEKAIRTMKEAIDAEAKRIMKEETIRIEEANWETTEADLSRIGDGFVTFIDERDGETVGMMQRSLDGRRIRVFDADGRLAGTIQTESWDKWMRGKSAGRAKEIRKAMEGLEGARIPIRGMGMEKEEIAFFGFLMSVFTALKEGLKAKQGNINVILSARESFDEYIQGGRVGAAERQVFRVLEADNQTVSARDQFPLQSGTGIGLKDGVLTKAISTPSVKRMGQDISLTFTYRSDMAISRGSRLVRFEGDWSGTSIGAYIKSVGIELWRMDAEQAVKVDEVVKEAQEGGKVEGILEWTPSPEDAKGVYGFEVRHKLTIDYRNEGAITTHEMEPVKTMLANYDYADSPFGAGWNMAGLMRLIPYKTRLAESVDVSFLVKTRNQNLSSRCVPAMLDDTNLSDLESRGYITSEEFGMRYAGLPEELQRDLFGNWCAVTQDEYNAGVYQAQKMELPDYPTNSGEYDGAAVLLLDSMGGAAVLKPFEVRTGADGAGGGAGASVLYRKLSGEDAALVKTSGGLSEPGAFILYSTAGNIYFDSEGYMERIEAADGAQVKYIYDPPADGDVERVLKSVEYFDASEKKYADMQLKREPHGQGKRLIVSDPAGRETIFTSDELNRVKTITLPDPDPTAYPTGIQAVSYEYYDAAGVEYLMRSSAGTNGAVSYYQYYEGWPTLKKYTAPAASTWGQRATVEFHPGMFMLLKTPIAGDCASEPGYDTVCVNRGAGAPDEQVLRYRTNEMGSIVESVDGAGRRAITERDANNNPTRVLFEPTGATVVNQYDVMGRLLNTNSGNVTSTTPTTHIYNKKGMLIRTIDYMNRETEFAYDAYGRVVETRGDMGLGAKYSYKAVVGLLESVADMVGNRTKYEYNEHGNVVKEETPTGDWVEYSYDNGAASGPGFVTRILNKKGDKAEIRYDRLGRTLKTMSFPANESEETVCYGYDRGGNQSWVLDPLQKSRVAGHGDCPSFTLEGTSAPAGATRFEYDRLNRLTSMRKPGSQAPSLTRAYSVGGLLNSVTDADGNAASYHYDSVGRLIRIDIPSFGGYPARSVVYSEYDDNDNPRRVSDGETWVEYERDPVLGWTTKIATGGAFEGGVLDLPETELSFSYYDDGMRQMMSERYRLSGGDWRAPFNMGGGGYQHNYLYDRLGRIISIRDAASRHINSFDYDVEGRLKRSYTDAIVGGMRATARDARYSFDESGRLTGLSNITSKGIVSSYVYAYDASGNRKTETIQNADIKRHRLFDYDGSDRLINVDHVDLAEGSGILRTTAESYSYDPLGNRASAERSGSAVSYLYNEPGSTSDPESGQKLKADTDWQYQYDNRGNLVRKLSNASNPRVEWRYHWDGSDRLRKAVFSNETTNTTLKVVEYYYDVLGRRAAKSIDGNADGAPDAVTKYAYDGDDILYEFDGSNALKARHTHGPGTDDPLYTQTGAAQYFYYHKDGMGSVREITNGAGEVARRNDYDSFGNIVSVNGCPTAPEYPAAPGAACDGDGDGDASFAPAHEFYFTYAYTGRQWDAETSLYHYRARYYDPHIGRFISEDPQWSPNLYAYVSNNPMKYTDPSGEIAHTMWYLLVFVPTVIMMVGLGTSLNAIKTAYKYMWNSFAGQGRSEFNIFDITKEDGKRAYGHLFVFEKGKLKGYYEATSGQIRGVCSTGGGPRIEDGTWVSEGPVVDDVHYISGMKYPGGKPGHWVRIITGPDGRKGIGYHFDGGSKPNNGTCGCIGLSKVSESKEFFGIVGKWDEGWTTDVITSKGVLDIKIDWNMKDP